MKKKAIILLIVGLLFLAVIPAAAQDAPKLALRMRRDFGYGGGNEIQGTFTMLASGPENLSKVVFYIDEQVMGEVTQAPFNLRFVTDNYSLGLHTLVAVGTTSDGLELRSNEITISFVSAEEGWQAGLAIAGPILGLTFVILLLSFGSMLFTGKKLKNLPPGTPRSYGAVGGAICPRCSRPYPRHVFAPNMVFGKLERCPFCGKWAVVRGYPLEALRAAEAAEVADAQNSGIGPGVSEEEKLRKDLDSSRYQDL